MKTPNAKKDTFEEISETLRILRECHYGSEKNLEKIIREMGKKKADVNLITNLFDMCWQTLFSCCCNCKCRSSSLCQQRAIIHRIFQLLKSYSHLNQERGPFIHQGLKKDLISYLHSSGKRVQFENN